MNNIILITRNKKNPNEAYSTEKTKGFDYYVFSPLLDLVFFTGLFIASSGMQGLIITILGVVNLCLGGLMGWLLLTQKPRVRDRRKKR